VDVGRLLDVLEGAGYSEWYVLEQDTEPKEGVGPKLDVGKSFAFVERRKD
jgi:inosose dehydratase